MYTGLSNPRNLDQAESYTFRLGRLQKASNSVIERVWDQDEGYLTNVRRFLRHSYKRGFSTERGFTIFNSREPLYKTTILYTLE